MGKKLKVINIYGGPGVGKSTTRAGLFHLMKLKEMEVEEVTEYAKDLTWEKRFTTLSDSVHVVAEQNNRLHRLVDQVDWAVSDSPLLIAIAYNSYVKQETYENLTWELYNKYDNYNFFLKRKKRYNPKGRNQTEKEATEKDRKIKDVLEKFKIEYREIDGDKYTPERILDMVLKQIEDPLALFGGK